MLVFYNYIISLAFLANIKYELIRLNIIYSSVLTLIKSPHQPIRLKLQFIIKFCKIVVKSKHSHGQLRSLLIDKIDNRNK